MLFSGLAQAQEDLFVVKDVEVDVTAGSALEAKNQAFEEAQKEAFMAIAKRLAGEDHGLDAPPADVISGLIKDFEITDEKLSRVRYIGTYVMRFEEQPTRDYFSGRGFSVSQSRGRPVLLLPFYREGSDTVLWSPDNEWMEAWNRSEALEGYTPVIVPIGDASDISDISSNDPMEIDIRALKNAQNRYDAEDAVIAVAGENEDTGAVTVQIYRTDLNEPELVQEIPVTGKGDAAFDAAVKSVFSALQKDWKAKTVVASATMNNLSARAAIANLQEWAAIQKNLRRVNLVKELNVKSVSPGEALVDLKYNGDIEQLRKAMARTGLTLHVPEAAEPDGGLMGILTGGLKAPEPATVVAPETVPDGTVYEISLGAAPAASASQEPAFATP